MPDYYDKDGEPIDMEALRRNAEAMFRTFAQIGAVTEAELALNGLHPVCVVTGYAENDEDARLIFDILPRLADDCGTVRRKIGGNDYMTYMFEGPSAEEDAVRFIAAVTEIAPSWWRVTPTAHPARS